MRAALGIAALGLELVIAAVLFAAKSLYVPGVALASLGLGVLAWVLLAARSVRVTRELDSRRVVEGERLGVVYEVRRGLVPAPAGVLEDAGLRLSLPLRARRRGMTRVRRQVEAPGRGRHVLPPPALAIGDPLGLVRRRVAGLAPREELLVLPRTSPVRPASGGAGAETGTAALAHAVESAGEVDGLRPYRQGAPAARIHWPALARGAGLVERRVHPEEDGRALVVLDARAPLTPKHLDAAVRAAASLCRALARRRGCTLLLPGERRALLLEREGPAWAAAHVRLALVEEAPPGAPAPRVAGARNGPIFYVAARELSSWPAALAASARGERTLVFPGEAPGRRADFTVAGCTGVRVTRARPRRAGVLA